MIIKFPFGLGWLLAPMACALSVAYGSAATLHTVPLAWNASLASGISGYRVHVGSTSGQYSQVFDAGTNLSLSVANMEFGNTYYFAVIAIGSTGLESLLSPELAVTIVQPPLPMSVGISVNASEQAGLN